MEKRVPFFLDFCIAVCYLFSYMTASVHYFFIVSRISKLPSYLAEISTKRYKCLQDIWSTRIVRRMWSVLVRSPFRKTALQIVRFKLPLPSNEGCVILMCHTPWKRLLVQWAIEHHFGMLVAKHQPAGGKRLKRIQGRGFKELREGLRWLRQKGSVIIMANVFNELDDCPVKFLGKQQNVSIFPARLAMAGSVPIIAAIPVLRGRRIDFIEGPRYKPLLKGQESQRAIREIITFIDNEIKKHPSIWPSYAG